MCTHDTKRLQQPRPHSPISTRVRRRGTWLLLTSCSCACAAVTSVTCIQCYVYTMLHVYNVTCIQCYVYTMLHVYNEGDAYTRVLHNNTTAKCQWCLHVPLPLHLQLQRRLQSRTAPASTRSTALSSPAKVESLGFRFRV